MGILGVLRAGVGVSVACAICLGAIPAAAGPPAAPQAVAGRPDTSAPRSELRRKLEDRLARLAAGLPGASGYLIRDLSGGESFEKDADSVFAAASTIKLPIYLTLLKRGEEGTIDLGRPVPIEPGMRVEGGGVLEKWSEPYPVLSADHLAVLMMDFSDNYATNLLLERLGVDEVQKRLRGWGMKNTVLRRRMMDLEAARAGRENVTTARDLVVLLEGLHRGAILAPEGARRALEVMKRDDGTPIKKGLPPGVAAADKSGELDGLRCDAGIVYLTRARAPGTGPFALAVMTGWLEDERAGEIFISDVTRAAFDYFDARARTSEYGRTIE